MVDQGYSMDYMPDKIRMKKDTDSAYTPYTNDKKWPKQLNFEDYFDHFYDFAYTYPTR
jgi:hypothetical protein